MQSIPVIDEHAPWKQRYRVYKYRGCLARCNPQRGLVISNRSGIFQLYAWNVADEKLCQLTQHSSGQEIGEISSDGRYIYHLNDTEGDETGHFVRIDIDTSEQIDLTPDAEPYSMLGIQTDCIGRMIAYVIADKKNGFQLFTQSVMTTTIDRPNLIYQTSNFTVKPVLSYNGELVVIEVKDIKKGTGSKLLVFDTINGGQQCSTLDDGIDVNVTPKQFAPFPNDTRLLATSNRSGVSRPLIWNVRTNERVDFILNQLDIEGEVKTLDWSHDGNFILLLHIHNATFQLYCYCVIDKNLEKLSEHPSGTIFDAQFGPNGSIFVQWANSNAPHQIIALDGKSGKLQRVVLGSVSDDVPSSHPWRSVTFPSSDGQMIQGWLTLSDINSDKPLPTIIKMHGGPEDVACERFDPETEMWVDHGFAHLSVNYRGSITFGRTFQHKIHSDIGHWEIEDVVAARTWLVEQGISQPNAILLTGWSYGGYLTLQALSKQPNLWAGGIAGVAIADWTMLYEDSAESLKGYEVTLFGGTPEEKPDLYKVASPITYVEQIIGSVLIIQASNDTRCPARQMKQYEAKMYQHNKKIEIEWFSGGHALNNTEQSISHAERMLRWAHHVLGTTT